MSLPTSSPADPCSTPRLRAHSGVPIARLVVAAALGGAFAAWAPFARAQQESAGAAMGGYDERQPKTSKEPEVHVRGEGRSPAWTQSRSFTGTRFWLLDPGEQEFEFWHTARLRKDGNDDKNAHLFQIEYMVSLIRGFQLDVYANYAYDKEGGARVEGAQVEGRFAFWRYGEVFLNPVLYLEWHPQNRDANRGEARLLLGGELGIPKLRAAVNPFIEQNLDSFTGKKADFIPDRELGASGAISYGVLEALSLGVEGRYAFDQQGGDDYQKSAKIGPAIWARFADNHMHFTGSAQIGLTNRSDKFTTIAILSYAP